MKRLILLLSIGSLWGCAGSPVATQNMTAREVANSYVNQYENDRLCEGYAEILSGKCDRERGDWAPGYCPKMKTAIELVLNDRGIPGYCTEKLNVSAELDEPIIIPPAGSEDSGIVGALWKSDDYSKYKDIFFSEAEKLILDGSCSVAEIKKFGGFWRSSTEKNTYFVDCKGQRFHFKLENTKT